MTDAALRVVITGASSRIGKSLAHQYAKRGATLALIARRGEISSPSLRALFRCSPMLMPPTFAMRRRWQPWPRTSSGELAGSGVSVVTICPGYNATPMTGSNRYRMPFLMDADVAAKKIAGAIARRKRLYVRAAVADGGGRKVHATIAAPALRFSVQSCAAQAAPQHHLGRERVSTAARPRVDPLPRTTAAESAP